MATDEKTGGAEAPPAFSTIHGAIKTPQDGVALGVERRLPADGEISVYPYVVWRIRELGWQVEDIVKILSTGVALKQKHQFDCTYIQSREERLKEVVIVVFLDRSHIYVTDVLDAANEVQNVILYQRVS